MRKLASIARTVRTDNMPALYDLVGFADEVLNTIIAVWNDVDKCDLLTIHRRRRNQPQSERSTNPPI